MFGKLGGVFYNTKEMIVLPMLLCLYLWHIEAVGIENLAYLLVGLTILCWIFLGNRLGLATISILASVSMFAIRAARWSRIEEYVNWGVIVMYGGAIALARALTDTHALQWMITHFLGPVQVAPLTLLVILSAMAIASA